MLGACVTAYSAKIVGNFSHSVSAASYTWRHDHRSGKSRTFDTDKVEAWIADTSDL